VVAHSAKDRTPIAFEQLLEGLTGSEFALCEQRVCADGVKIRTRQSSGRRHWRTLYAEHFAARCPGLATCRSSRRAKRFLLAALAGPAAMGTVPMRLLRLCSFTGYLLGPLRWSSPAPGSLRAYELPLISSSFPQNRSLGVTGQGSTPFLGEPEFVTVGECDKGCVRCILAKMTVSKPC
jgi:hypothetical protein